MSHTDSITESNCYAFVFEKPVDDANCGAFVLHILYGLVVGNIVSYLNGILVCNTFLHCIVKATTGTANSSCYSNCEG